MAEPLLAPFPADVILASFVGRRKRFFADMLLADGRQVTAHCANTGSMRQLLVPGAPCLLRMVDKPSRKLPYSWIAVKVMGVWVGIDTALPNRLVAAAIDRGFIPALGGYTTLLRERPMGANSRVDILLSRARDGELCFVEVKNVTLVERRVARFPDAVTTRGLKHLRELTRQVRLGNRAAMVYVIQRADGRAFAPADEIDAAYGHGLRAAIAAGVEVYALGCRVGPRGVRLRQFLPLSF